MLSVKRLCQILLIIVLISAAFFMLNMKNSSKKVSEDRNSDYKNLEDLEYTDAQMPQDVLKQTYLVVYRQGSETEDAVMKNVSSALKTMKLSYRQVDSVSEEELQIHPVLIFCNESVSGSISVTRLGSYVSGGGLVMFAAGLPEGFKDSYLQPIWGITEKGNRKEMNEFVIKAGTMPYGTQDTRITYDGFNSSTSIKTNDKAEVLVESGDGVPLVYISPYAGGRAAVVNGTMLDNRYSGGIFSSTLCRLLEELLYPVIGTETVFLDCFPLTADINDQSCTKLYGRGRESFMRDMFWPDLLKYAVSFDFKYTANILEQPTDIRTKEKLNERLFVYLLKENLRYSGEIMFSEDHSKTEFQEERGHSVYQLFEQLYPSYTVGGYSILYGETDSKTIKDLRSTYQEAQIYRGRYQTSEENQRFLEYGMEEGLLSFPVMSEGYTLEEAEYAFLSGVSLQGVISHSFNIEEILQAGSEEESWDKKHQKCGILADRFFKGHSYLSAATLSEAAAAVRAYGEIRFTTRSARGKLEVFCRNQRRGQKFYLCTDNRIKEIENGRFTKINDSYYCIEALQPEFTIIYE